MITVESKGGFPNTERFFKRVQEQQIFSVLDRYGQEGVKALAHATPVDSHLTASSWTYEILRQKGSYSIIWGNTNVVDGRPIAILIQYGHGTGTGGYVAGRDYINPALRPIFDRAVNVVWKEVTTA
jgi:hypothetical protein